MTHELVSWLRACATNESSNDDAAKLWGAADLIESLRSDLEQARSVEETTHGLYTFWNAKAAELAASNDALRSELVRIAKEREEDRKRHFEEAAQVAYAYAPRTFDSTAIAAAIRQMGDKP